MNMTVAHIGLKFNPEVPCNEALLSFPEDAEVLSVEVRGNKPTLYINFMAPSENMEIDVSKKIHFLICKCDFTEFDIKRYRYIGNVRICQESFAVFCS